MSKCQILTWRPAILNLVFVKTSNLGEFVTLSPWLSDATEIPNVEIKVAQWNKNLLHSGYTLHRTEIVFCGVDLTLWKFSTGLYCQHQQHQTLDIKNCHLKFQTVLIAKRLVPGNGYWPEISRCDRRMQPIRWSSELCLTCNNPCQFHFLPYLLSMKNIISNKNQHLNGVLLPIKNYFVLIRDNNNVRGQAWLLLTSQES